MMESITTHQGLPRTVEREKLFVDVLAMYREHKEELFGEFPLRIKYKFEDAIDTGGVCRDIFSAFWEEAYIEFEGERLVIPSVRPGVDMAKFKLVGTILVHGFMVCGFLPIRLAFPVVAAVLLGPDVVIPDNILMESFIDYLACHESEVLHNAVLQVKAGNSLTPGIKCSLVDLLSRFGCTEMPSVTNLLQLIASVAQHLFMEKAFSTLHTMWAGVPVCFLDFWKRFDVPKLFRLFKALNATPASVLKLIQEPDGMNAAEERVHGYLLTLIGGLRSDELRSFLRFVSGSSVLVSNKITLSFNSLAGLARRPISHTCTYGLELSIAYSTYPEFEHEFKKVLSSELSWFMDAV